MKRIPVVVIFIVLLLSITLSSCGPATPAPIEPGSIIICPKHYEPGVSKCRVKVSVTDVSATPQVNSLTEQEYPALLLRSDQAAVYKSSSETYDAYRGAGYHPIPDVYAYTYPDVAIKIMADIDPNACGGAHNESTCLSPKKNIVLKGQVKFESSYTWIVSFNLNDRTNYQLFYEAGGLQPLLKEFNERTRDIMRESGDLDPQGWLNQTLSYEAVAKYWRNKIENSEQMKSWPYFKLIKIVDLSVRYFEPMKMEAGSDVQSEEIKADQEFNNKLIRRDLYCAQYASGSYLRAECERTFECSETDKVCYFGGAIIPFEQITPTPAVPPTTTP